MKILVVGGGGREHALVWSMHRRGHDIVCAPGNPGMAQIAECVPCQANDLDRILSLAAARRPDLVVVGPEAPLVAGLADRLRAQGMLVFGPSAEAAQLEGSKLFGKQFFARHGIPSADFFDCSTVEAADHAISALGGDVVVKVDGLAAGKGVVVAANAAEARTAARAMLSGRFGNAGERIVIERKLTGRELSVMAITDGKRFELLAAAEDHKRIFDGDRGPNTGGMGTVSPASWATDALLERVRRDIFEPTLAGLAADRIDYRGVLFAGLMVDATGAPFILEYNCRFGDPETQPVLARLDADVAEWLAGAAAGELPAGHLAWDSRAAVCVILASAGYPESARSGSMIDGVDQAEQLPDVLVFHAGTSTGGGGELVTAGGRVLAVTALGDDVAVARARAYQAVEAIQFDGMQYRHDIGARQS